PAGGSCRHHRTASRPARPASARWWSFRSLRRPSGRRSWQQQVGLAGQDVRDDRRASPTDVLRHADLGVGDLVLACLAAKLRDEIDDLVHARLADRMPRAFSPPIVLMGMRPSRAMPPSAASWVAQPGSAKPAASRLSAAIML